MGETSNPGYDCIIGKHLFAEALDEAGTVVVSWCLWDGGGVYDGDRVIEAGDSVTPVGWTPTYQVSIPDGWHRRPSDVLGPEA